MSLSNEHPQDMYSWKNIWACTQDHNSYGSGQQGRLRRRCADSPEPLLLVHKIKILTVLVSREGSGESVTMRRLARAFAADIHKSMDVDEDSDQNIDLALLNMSIWRIIRVTCVYGLSTKILCADPNMIRPNKKRPVFRVTQPYLNLLVKPGIFSSFLGKKLFLCILKGEMLFKMQKIIYFFPEKNNLKKYVCLPYLNLSDPLPKTHLFFYLD